VELATRYLVTTHHVFKYIFMSLSRAARHMNAVTRSISAVTIMVIILIAAGAVYYYSRTQSNMPSTSALSSSSSTAGPVTIQFYEALAPSEVAYFTNIIVPQFEVANPDIKVKLDNLPSASDVATSVEALVKGGNAGTTLIGIDNLVVGELVYSNSLMDLSPFLSSIEPQGFITSAQKMVGYEQSVYNATYFIPFRSNIPLTFYSKIAFAKAGITSPPATTEQLMAAAQALQAVGYTGPLMFQGNGRDASAPTELYQWIVQFGGNPFLLNDTGSFHTFQYLWDLSQYFNPDYVNGYWGSYLGLSSGKYQILDYQWPYVYNLLTNSTLGMNNRTLGVYPGPVGPVNGNHVLGGDVLVIPTGATNVDSLVKFANFLLSAQVQTETLINLSWVAVNSAAYANLPANNSDVGQALQEGISQGVFLRNPVPWITQWNNIAYDAFTKIIINHAPSSQIQIILNSENRQMYQYLLTNFGAQVADQYEQNMFRPISVS
jgi:trehalose transport system substrate-binding protein